MRTSNRIDFRLLKAFSKKIKVTINDIVTSALTTAMNQIFKDHKDSVNDFTLCIPVNIRFAFYPTVDSIKLENKFAVVPLKVPVTDQMETAYTKVQKATKSLRSALSFTYFMYAMCFYSNIVTPRFAPKWFVESVSNKYTMAFSNTPGPIKPFIYKNEKGEPVRTLQSSTYIIVAGIVGVNIAAMSFVNSFKITCCSDTAVFQDNGKLVELIEKNIRDEISRSGVTLDDYYTMESKKTK